MLDAERTELYERVIGGPGEEYGYSAAFDDDGNLFVTGFSHTDADHERTFESRKLEDKMTSGAAW